MFNVFNRIRRFRSNVEFNRAIPVTYGHFGSDVSLSNNGNVMLVVSGTNSNSTHGGYADIYRRSGNNWVFEQGGFPATGLFLPLIGFKQTCISGDGNRFAIGEQSYNPGKVTIYVWNGSTWQIEQSIVAGNDDDNLSNHQFGNATDLSYDGSTLVVGAHLWDTGSGAGNDDLGAVFVYTRSGSVWSLQQKITNTSAKRFGNAVSLSNDGNTLLVGAPLTNGSKGTSVVYTRSNNVWSLEGTLSPSSANSFYSGQSVSLSGDGNTALIGQPISIAGGFSDGGTAAIYTRSNNVWTLKTELVGANPYGLRYFGNSVSLSPDGKKALIGSPGRNNPPTTFPSTEKVGSASYYELKNNTWVEIVELTSSTRVAFDYFGDSVSISNNGIVCAIGCPFKGNESGNVRIFYGR